MARTSGRAFARLIGVTHKTVQRAIDTGRLDKSLGHDARGPFIRDVAMAREEWARNAAKASPTKRAPKTEDERVDEMFRAYGQGLALYARELAANICRGALLGDVDGVEDLIHSALVEVALGATDCFPGHEKRAKEAEEAS